MRESSLERGFVNRIKKAGGLCWKFTAPGVSGVPDRVAVLPGGRVCFIELKRDGGVISEVQKIRIKELNARGTYARVCVGKTGLEEFYKDVGI